MFVSFFSQLKGEEILSWNTKHSFRKRVLLCITDASCKDLPLFSFPLFHWIPRSSGFYFLSIPEDFIFLSFVHLTLIEQMSLNFYHLHVQFGYVIFGPSKVCIWIRQTLHYKLKWIFFIICISFLWLLYRLGGLKKQKYILSQFWRPTAWNPGISRAMLPLSPGHDLPWILLGSWWLGACLQSLVASGLQLHCFSLCLCCHMVFSLCVSIWIWSFSLTRTSVLLD